MPKFATELTQGQAFTRSSEDNGLNDTSQRVYKVILNHPAEVFDPQAFCGVYVGYRHPFNLNQVCFSFDAKFDGDSRMVAIVTFNYKSFATAAASANQPDPKTIQPEIRPANWSTDTSLMDIPSSTWRECDLATGQETGAWSCPRNPAGDRYEGVTKMVPITTIRIDQYEPTDPMRWTSEVGKINSKVMTVGSRSFALHTVMLRGISSKPHVETFQATTFKGWTATYEFVYKANVVILEDPAGGGGTTVVEAGWDHLQILEGLYVKNDVAGLARADTDPYGMALAHAAGEVITTLALAAGMNGKRTRAMVAVPSADGRGGVFQRPATAPIPLNADGTPRDVYTGNLRPLIKRYQKQDSVDFVSKLGLRLQ